MTQAFPLSGGKARRLAEISSAGTTDGLVGSELSEGPGSGGKTSAVDKEAGFEKEEAIFFDKDDAHSQQSARLDDPMEYVDHGLAGEDVPEGKTTRTSIRVKGKKAKVSLDAAQWTALIAAIGMLLAAGGWQLSEKLELFPKPHKKVMQLPTFDFNRLESQQAELQLSIDRLRRVWQHSSENARVSFIGKLETHMQPFEAEAASVNQKTFEDALSSLLLPAFALRGAPVPESAEEQTTLREQLMLVNGSLAAAQVQLSVMTQLKEGQKVRGDDQLPPLEKLKAQETDLVSATQFFQMVAGKTVVQLEEEEAEDTPRIPRILAQAVADYLHQSELRAVAAAGTEDAFALFMNQYEETEEPPADLDIPGGGRFPTGAFIALVDQIREVRRQLPPSSSEAMLKLVGDFSVDNAAEILDRAKDNASRRRELTRLLIENALKATSESEGEPPAEYGSFYRTLLALFDDAE
ncbi:hypothetical protein ACSSS7_004427 [Eimeria intestinalis]